MEWEKELWNKFKSPLGNSSIDNKNNSMYDLEDFIKELLPEKKEKTLIIQSLICLQERYELKEHYQKGLNGIFKEKIEDIEKLIDKLNK